MADGSTRCQLLPEFDPALYRDLNADLAGMDADEAYRHYMRFGVKEGRVATMADVREGFLAEMVLKESGDVLEIGPFCSPIFTGDTVYYLDILDSSGLRERAREHGLDSSRCPETIHFTCPLSEIHRTFDVVISSHAIEHQPDLISHFNDIARVLRPGGRYYIIIPDKRFCFDALLAESSVADVLQASREERRRHTAASVIEHLALTTHNDPTRHWSGDHGALEEDIIVDRVRSAIKNYEDADGAYLDTHAWRFTPDSFRQIVGVTHRLGLSSLEPARIYNTPHGRLEFCAVLQLPDPAAEWSSRDIRI